MKILIVDDSGPMRAFLRDLMLRLTPNVSTADDGDTAVQRYESEMPDVVLMDVRMPRMDGITATARIRALDPSASIVIVTEHDKEWYREEARQAGAVAYFLKEDLMDLLRYLRDGYMNPK
ncbi:MAG: response regulator transcription factor [Bacteroidota bacterium]|nr:response regulator transcription factor [Bacteroidota bacterium]